MQSEGPQREPLLHRLTDCPADCRTAGEPGQADVVAIACDLVRALGSTTAPEANAPALARLRKMPAPQASLVAIVCWLLYDEWFQQQSTLVVSVWELLTSDRLAKLASLARAERFVEDADRREELVRVCLTALGLRPQGESTQVASDRLSQLDTVERDRVLRATAAAERRAREIREAMARKQALEASSRYGE